ncbi:putative UDP-arabinose 4-epimerase 3 [Artemisia annua]|uniref:Putative UDP-arabinose 4-epimerase 3 n=1 Tax=Artemisia annua TaxID=35608 RepID=A0A2U1LUU8_ARTAN|nr:putative UDP-arabinose 4-epimerase 3 [Artemisia annua]
MTSLSPTPYFSGSIPLSGKVSAAAVLRLCSNVSVIVLSGVTHVLVTGGAGYIGSHAALRLLKDNHLVTIVHNLSRGNLGGVKVLQGLFPEPGRLQFIYVDLGDPKAVNKIFSENAFDAVIHFAVVAYVGESTLDPLKYFNVIGSDPEGRLGEAPRPELREHGRISGACFHAASGITDGLKVRGTNYKTPDGTCIRDYIDVTDLVDAHAKALAKATPGHVGIYNVGTGRAVPVAVVRMKRLQFERNCRLDIVSSSTHDESEDADEQPLVRHRTRRVSSSSTEAASRVPHHNLT